MQRGKVIFLIKSLVTVFLIIIIFRSITGRDLVAELHNFNWITIGPLVLLIIGFLALGGVNNWLVVQAVVPLSLREVLRMHFVSASVGMFTPAYVGEFASMSYLLKEQGLSTSESLAIPMVDKIITLLVNMVLALVGLALYFPETEYVVYVFGLAAIVVPALLLSVDNIRHAVFSLISKRVPWIAPYLYTCASFFMYHPILLSLNILVSIARAVVGAMCIWVLLVGFGADVQLMPVLFLNFVVRMVTFIPLTINGLGILEGTAMLLFQRIGVAPELSFLSFFMSRLLCLIIGFAIIAWVNWGGFTRRPAQKSIERGGSTV